MSSTASGVHSLNIRDTGACARIDVWDAHTCAGVATSSSSSSSSSKPGGESASASGTGSIQGSGTDGPPPLPTRSDALCLPSATGDGDSEAAAALRDLRRTRIPSPPQLQSVYGLWSMCVACDVEDSRVPLPLDGDIFGVGKRPVQHEVETDGCVRLVFAEIEEVDD